LEESLSPAERQILKLLLTGKDNKGIAAALRVSDKTVKNHISHILAKTGSESRLELTVKVFRARERQLKRRLRPA
jgi:DNA-binding NarL/FixJ family response regulator